MDDDLRIGPLAVHLLDEVDVRGVVLGARDAVDGVVVVEAEVDDDDVGGFVGRKGPRLRVGAVEFVGAVGGVGCLEPLVFLAMRVVVAWCVVEADAGEGLGFMRNFRMLEVVGLP